MVFIEMPIFTRLVTRYLRDDEYHALQRHLIKHPDAGAVIPGAKGLRKMRWAAEAKGKRGGVRIIYYWITRENQIIFFTIYKKSTQDELTKERLNALMEYLK